MKIDSIKKQLIVMVMLFSIVNSYSQITKAEIIATGLTCSMCSNAINKQLKAMPEVEKVMIDLNNNTFVVNFKKNSAVTPEILKTNIEKTGFFVGSMILTMEVDRAHKNNEGFKNESGNYILIDSKGNLAEESVRLKVINSGFVTKKEYKQSAKLLAKYSVAKEDVYFVKTI